MMPRYNQESNGYNNPPTSSSMSNSMHGGLYGGQSGMVQRNNYQRQYSEPTMSSSQGFNSEFSGSNFDMPKPTTSAARPITNKHLRNE